MDHTINQKSLGAAAHFACISSSRNLRSHLMEACCQFASSVSGMECTESSLKGVCPLAAEELAKAFQSSKRILNSCERHMQTFLFIDRWVRANKPGVEEAGMFMVANLISLKCLPPQFILQEVLPSGLLLPSQETIMVFVKTLTGKTLSIYDLNVFDTVDSLMQKICVIENYKIEQLRLIFSGKQLEPGFLLIQCNISNESTIHAMYRMMGDIGFFGRHEKTHGIHLLVNGGAGVLSRATASDSVRLIKEFPGGGASLVDVPVVGSRLLLGQNDCRLLRMLIDDQYAIMLLQGKAPANGDLVIDMSEEQLRGMLGHTTFEDLLQTFNRDRDTSRGICIRLRRTEARNMCIQFHTDKSRRTMQVVLNNEEEYEGGRLVFATHKGFVQPCRVAGSYSIHPWNVLHGVTAMTEGVRYGLFFLSF